MKANLNFLVATFLIASFALFDGSAIAQVSPVHPQSFRVENGKFLLDGKPFQIISGEMHYPRIPRAYWRDRFRMARAMGLNAVTAYVFWNEHELRPGVYDFSGQRDVAEFIREAQSEGLYVILRPGPYVCAEWEWGGYPAWLLKDHGIVVRSTDPKFMEPARRWLLRLGKHVVGHAEHMAVPRPIASQCAVSVGEGGTGDGLVTAADAAGADLEAVQSAGRKTARALPLVAVVAVAGHFQQVAIDPTALPAG